MASKLNPGVDYFEDFDTGQGGGVQNYVTYHTDLKTNFAALRARVNAMIDELSAMQAPNAAAIFDLLRVNDADGPLGKVSLGVVGEHSYRTAIKGGDATRLTVQEGQALVPDRVELVGDVELVGSGGSGTRWVAIDSGGIPSLQTSAGQKALDVASVNWSGSAFTGAVAQLAEVLLDGDDYAAMRRTDGHATAGVPTHTHRSVADRIANLERLMRGVTASAESGGPALGRAALVRGSAAAPGLILTDGSTYDATSGLYRKGADDLGIAIGGVQVANVDSNGLTLAAGKRGATAWGASTPTWLSTGTNPSIGNGSIALRYFQFGKLVVCTFNATFGSTTTYGTGSYAFNLPVLAAGLTGARRGFLFSQGGEFYDDSTGDRWSVRVGVETALTFTFYTIPEAGGAGATQVGATVPFTWAQDDEISGVFLYEAS